ncbi:MAG: TonB-dependent receptor [Saprospiraceae bacterium]
MKKIYLPILLVWVLCPVLFTQTLDSLKSVNLEEVVVSGNKVIEKKSDIPHHIDVLLSPKISLLSAQTTADVLSNSGSVFVQKSQQGGGSPVLRGFEANRVLLVIDGVRMNNAIYRAGHLQNSITTDPNMMERIEVLHGAGSVIYGTDALGGVISFFTKRPQLADSSGVNVNASGFLRYSSANQGQTAHGSVNIGSKRWASLTGITVSDFGDLRSGSNDMMKYPGFGDANFYVKRVNGRDSVFQNSDPDVQKFSGYRQLDVLQKVLFTPSDDLRHTLNFQFSTSSDVPRYDRLQQQSNGQPRYAEWYYGPQERLLVSYEMQKDQKAWWGDLVRFTPAFQMIGESRHDRRLNSDETRHLNEDLKIYSANLDIFKEVQGHEIRYGGEFIQNQLESTGTNENIVTGATTSTFSRYPDGNYTTMGLYFSHRWELLDKQLIISDGLRFSSARVDVNFDENYFETELAHVRQTSHSENLHLGAVAVLPDGFRLNVLFSTGYRNPNIDDLGRTFETNGGDLIVANPDLRPEQVFYREIGITTLGSNASLSVTAYLSSLTDAIIVRPFAMNGQDSVDFNGSRFRTLANTNTGRAKVWGATSNLRWKITPHLAFRGNLSFTQGRDLTNDVPLDHIPPFFGNFSLFYGKNKWQAEAYFLFNARKRLDDYSPSGEDNLNYATPDGTPAWQTWNLKTSYQFSKHLRLQAGVENLLDLNYRNFASGINAPGRNFVVSLHVN